MNNIKTVSVVMATYNGEKYIREQLESIIAQDYPIHELLIQDDCSNDGTVSICKEYESMYPFIHVYVNDKNIGLNENFRTLVMRTTGDYVAISDQDDIWFPEKISKMVAAIGLHSMCYSQHLRGESQASSHLVDYKNAPERHLFKGVVGHSMLLDGDFARDESTWPGGVAYDIWLTALANYKKGVVRVAEPLNWHRTHNEQASKGMPVSESLWKPYVLGYVNYWKLQKTEGWVMFNRRIKEESKLKNQLVFKLTSLLLRSDHFSLLQLCLLCHKHRNTIYPSDRTMGLMGHIRGFFFPMIHAYYGEGFYKIWK